MNTKGAYDIIFKLLLTAIVGGVILMFFIRFAYQHVDLSESINVRELTSYMDDQLEAFSISSNSNKIITLNEEAPIIFDCDTLGGEGYSTKTTKIIFSPSLLEGKQIQAWTQEWQYPFGIVNFYYLGNKNHRTLIIYDDSSVSYALSLELPEIFNVQKIHRNNFNIGLLGGQQGTNQQSLHLIFFTDAGNTEQYFTTLRRTNLHIVEIDEQNKEATIYSRSGSNSVAYLGEAQLFGLMFGPGSYTCLYQKALERLHIISDIYAHKATLLASKELRQNCKDKLAQAYQTLQTYQTLTNKNDLYDYSSQIAQQNAALERNDCPKLY